MHIDHLLVGQGISGTLLSRSLMQHGAKVVVIDNGSPATASRVASGVINPVTGKRLVRTWMADELLPFAWNTYKAIENELGVSIARKCSILDMHRDPAAQSMFNDKQPAESEYLHTLTDTAELAQYFSFNYGIGEVSPVILVDINTLLSSWRQHLIANDALLQDQFKLEDLTVNAGNVIYKGITARNIIFCDGAVCAGNPYFDRLPWSKDKGEALIVSIPGLPQDHIYRHGLSIVPWHHDRFWVGATHDWNFTDMLPSAAYRQQVAEQLGFLLKIPFTITAHLVGQRPVNVDRKPFVGLHPVHHSIGIFNGMGTKGCSVAPWFAQQLAAYLVGGQPLLADVDVQRYKRVLSR